MKLGAHNYQIRSTEGFSGGGSAHMFIWWNSERGTRRLRSHNQEWIFDDCARVFGGAQRLFRFWLFFR
jgi:hypothetical protein